jgi:CheY-like chemotaxis protein
LQNAVKFTEDGGRIALRVAREGGDVVISVTDTGVGIPLEMLSGVFELFTQSDRGHGGLGIGLALVRRLAELHGGSVTAHSDGPGRGTTVVVRLPLLASDASSPTAVPREADPVSGSRRVLIADDNEDAATALAMHLTLLGHDVRVTHDGLEALAVASTFEPEVVLLDLGMPRMDGCDTAREMRRQPWGVRATLVAVTGWGQPEDRRATAEAGFDVHLVKPVDGTRLFQVLAGDRAVLDSNAAAGQG